MNKIKCEEINHPLFSHTQYLDLTIALTWPQLAHTYYIS